VLWCSLNFHIRDFTRAGPLLPIPIPPPRPLGWASRTLKAPHPRPLQPKVFFFRGDPVEPLSLACARREGFRIRAFVACAGAFPRAILPFVGRFRLCGRAFSRVLTLGHRWVGRPLTQPLKSVKGAQREILSLRVLSLSLTCFLLLSFTCVLSSIDL
jgi:hypothetical protein